MDLSFDALEFHADESFRPARYRLRGTPADGWTILRNGSERLRLGPGYRLLRTTACGVCSTDLARARLTFPLPQVTGHELVARDEDGRRVVVEINASHRARGVEAGCPFCDAGLATHCPDRLVLGIDELPGGFGPFVLAPRDATIPVPDELPDRSAVLVEPFAAALHAVATVAPRAGDAVAVLGPRRLGMLVVAALAAWRERERRPFELLALARHESLCALATQLGADRAERVVDDGSALPERLADVVIDTTGNPDALPLAQRLARREVHVKSTHGRPSAGLAHLTELVVDELTIEGLPSDPAALRPLAASAARIAWLSREPLPPGFANAQLYRGGTAAELLTAIERSAGPGELPRADLAVVDDAAGCDAAIRPIAGRELALVRPRGTILCTRAVRPDTPLGDAVRRGLRISSSRCGDFRAALELLVRSPVLRDLGERLVTDVLPAARVAEAFATARSPACLKAVVEHPPMADR